MLASQSERLAPLRAGSGGARGRRSAVGGVPDAGLQPACDQQSLALAVSGIRTAIRRRAQLHLSEPAALAPTAGRGHDGGSSGYAGSMALGPWLLPPGIYHQQAVWLVAVCLWCGALAALPFAGVGGALAGHGARAPGGRLCHGAGTGGYPILVLALPEPRLDGDTGVSAAGAGRSAGGLFSGILGAGCAGGTGIGRVGAGAGNLALSFSLHRA